MKNTTKILTKDEIKEMLGYINEMVIKNDCDGTLKYTEKWLKNKVKKEEIEVILEEIQAAGGYCDCEVLMNAAEELMAN